MKPLQNNFTTSDQSKRLLELGVPVDSADGFYSRDNGHRGGKWVSPKLFESDDPKDKVNFKTCYEGGITMYYPLWTVGRLMEIYDICFIYPKSRSSWCAYIRVKGVLFSDYILDCYEKAIADNYIDFSELK